MNTAIKQGHLFTVTDLANYRAYERVRQGGRFNMYDPRVRLASKLSSERYAFVMSNYSALRAQQEAR